ncbi:hypothetical protein HY041_00525 [Candidatus Roizmanbacteria bacterium]|nr:hypothetical protein [Candidatus Roizmanbacteria bacterium]
MEKLLQIFIVILAGASVAIGDIFIKKSAIQTHNLIKGLINPFMMIAVSLYLLQIVLFYFIFIKKWELGIVGLMQMIVYAAIVITAGIVFFQERITFSHGIGMILALIGAILMNL